jgi:hypothetical protein
MPASHGPVRFTQPPRDHVIFRMQASPRPLDLRVIDRAKTWEARWHATISRSAPKLGPLSVEACTGGAEATSESWHHGCACLCASQGHSSIPWPRGPRVRAWTWTHWASATPPSALSSLSVGAQRQKVPTRRAASEVRACCGQSACRHPPPSSAGRNPPLPLRRRVMVLRLPVFDGSCVLASPDCR